MRLLSVLIVLSLGLQYAEADNKGKVVTVEATYSLEIPPYMSYDQACREGIVKAKNQAIDSVFYSVLSGFDEVTVKNTNANSEVSLLSIHRSQVKGVWLGDLAKPQFKRVLADDGRDFLYVTVKGKVRELKSAGIQFEALPLRVKPDLKLQTNTFKNGDDFFLYFRSPVNGFLTVFLFDTNLNEVCYMLPYQSSGEGYYAITHDVQYTFFSTDKAKPDDGEIDEFVMTCSDGNKEEYDELYVVFSPNKYVKKPSTLEKKQLGNDLILPDRMDYEGFNKWLTEYQQIDEDMQIARIPIRVSKK